MLYTAGAFHMLTPFHWEHTGRQLGRRVAVLGHMWKRYLHREDAFCPQHHEAAPISPVLTFGLLCETQLLSLKPLNFGVS